ncbi:MAG: hypothetical protein WA700_06910 [Acidobacteriaceae bacterium]
MEIAGIVEAGRATRDLETSSITGRRGDCKVGRITIGLQEFSIELNLTLI